MKQALPFIIGILIVVFQMYRKYQEEQSKALQRQAQLRKQAEKASKTPVVRSNNWQDKYEAAIEERLNPMNEVNRAKFNRKDKKNSNKLPQKPPLEVVELAGAYQFDLKNAIIQQAILNRPNYD
ncbi:hypothetical protein J5U18_01850 [Sphingobacteriaceae bacterium WQ 2009]|uniref:Uncharacterized protein n=1 Tax=Rhinopithecimicrobium faecis TaxID=2820698 RepID=A0A8T4HAE2_9SPHI|nr:hypothetical protein [Sphingobacteriaceae bacterium WQ 2009]